MTATAISLMLCKIEVILNLFSDFVVDLGLLDYCIHQSSKVILGRYSIYCTPFIYFIYSIYREKEAQLLLSLRH